jgi:hypothetical protein
MVTNHVIYTRDVKPVPDGKYTVRRDGKRAWLESSIEERIQQRIAERPQSRQLIFQTRSVKNARGLKRVIDGAKRVVLVPYAMVNGVKVNDAIVADGKVVGNFVCKVKGADGQYIVSPAINNLYRNKYGVVTYSHPVSYENGEDGQPKGEGLLVVMDEVKLMTNAELQQTIAEAQVADVYTEATKKPAFKSANAQGRLASMAAAMNEEESAEPAPQATQTTSFKSKRCNLAELLKQKASKRAQFSAEDFE